MNYIKFLIWEKHLYKSSVSESGPQAASPL